MEARAGDESIYPYLPDAVGHGRLFRETSESIQCKLGADSRRVEYCSGMRPDLT